MNFKLKHHLRNALTAFALILSFETLYAVELTLRLLDSSGRVAQDIAVSAFSTSNQQPNFTDLPSPVIDQVDRQFVPHVSIIPVGTKVYFPNSDSIKHHLFSFSPAKTFQKKLYREETPEPVLFDKPGEIVLGCNIHDWMLGYIYVVETDRVGVTNEFGKLTLKLMENENYQLKFMSPRFQSGTPEQVETINTETEDFELDIVLKSLSPKNNAFEIGDDFDAY